MIPDPVIRQNDIAEPVLRHDAIGRPGRLILSRNTRQDHACLQGSSVILRAIGLICRGHRAVALENLALRQQPPADLRNVRWISHCRDLVQLPVAA